MLFLPILGTALSNTANATTTATGAVNGISWIHKQTTQRTINGCRDDLHQAMIILNDLVKENIPDIDEWISKARLDHETLTSQADNVEKAGARVSFWSFKGPVKTVSLLVDARSIKESTEILRGRVQRVSDIAYNKRMGNGTLMIHRISSNLSLISTRSEVAGTATRTSVIAAQGALGGNGGTTVQASQSHFDASSRPSTDHIVHYTEAHISVSEVSNSEVAGTIDDPLSDAIRIDIEPEQIFRDEQPIVSILLEHNPWADTANHE